MFAYALGLSILAALVFGLAPLRTARGAPPGLVLKSSSLNSTADRGRVRGTRIVLAGQIALCVALLVGAGLLVRTLRNLDGAYLGLRTSGLFVFGVTAPSSVTSDTAVVQFYQSLIERVRSLPGVESATLMGNRIGSGWSNNTTAIIDGAAPTGSDRRMRWNNVGPDYFRVLGTPILLGRDFTDADLTRAADGDRERRVRACLFSRSAGDRAYSCAFQPGLGRADTRSSEWPPTAATPAFAKRWGRWPTSCTRTCRRRRSCISRCERAAIRRASRPTFGASSPSSGRICP